MTLPAKVVPACEVFSKIFEAEFRKAYQERERERHALAGSSCPVVLLITLRAEVVSVCEIFSLKIFLLRRNFANVLSAFFVLLRLVSTIGKSKADSTLSTSQPVP